MLRLTLFGVIAALASACTHHSTTFTGHAVHASLVELRAEGHARVATESGEEPLGLDDEVSASFEVGPSEELTVRELSRHCTDPAADADAALTQSPDEPSCPLLRVDWLVLETIDWGTTALNWITASLYLGALGGVGYCVFECDSPWNIASGVTLAALAFVPLALGAYYLATGIRAH